MGTSEDGELAKASVILKSNENILYTFLLPQDASWSCISIQRLEEAFCRCESSFNPQEICNSIYGFAILDSSWKDLSYTTKMTMVQALNRNAAALDNQEIANIMYSVALMTFDANIDNSILVSCLDMKNSPPIKLVCDNDSEQQILWKMHIINLWKYRNIDLTACSRENYDQFAIYFELMDIIPGGKELVKLILGDSVAPCYSGPCGTIPSRLHANSVHWMMQYLDQLETGRFSLFNEYSGLRGVFPIDAAVYDRGELLAFIEIDGESHYKQVNQMLRRKDRLKEYLYEVNYPSIKLFRIRSDQVHFLSMNK